MGTLTTGASTLGELTPILIILKVLQSLKEYIYTEPSFKPHTPRKSMPKMQEKLIINEET